LFIIEPVERTEQFKDAEIENHNKNPGNKKSTTKCVTKVSIIDIYVSYWFNVGRSKVN